MMRGLSVLLLVLAGLPLGGCALFGGVPAAAVPPNPELEYSRNLIDQAAHNATINTHFRGDLERARATLDQALMIWNEERGRLDEDDEEWHEIRHLNHMARQRTALIVMQARALDAQYGLNELQSERERQQLAQSHKQAVTRSATTAGQSSLNLPQVLQALRPRQEPRGLVLTLDDSYFAQGQGQLVADDALFDALLQYLVANPGKIVSCEGHAGELSAKDNGQRLSQARARAVQDALLERGLELSRVTAVGYGNTSQAAASQQNHDRLNRVEIVLSDTTPVDFDAKPAD
jgi:outer membrane protein OmpA-like peptidoglycan-associated protein